MNKTFYFKFVLILSIVTAAVWTQAQLNFDWAVTQGSIGTNYFGSYKIDDQGHLYLVGSFEYAADLDPGPVEDIVDGAGTHIVALSKFNKMVPTCGAVNLLPMARMYLVF